MRRRIYRPLERAGRRRIEPAGPPPKTSRLVPHPGTITGDPEDLVSLDWSGGWRP